MSTGIQNWSQTAATNASADSSINWPEGQAPSSVNDSARAMMARLADLYKDMGGITTGGSSTAFTVTTNRAFAASAIMDKSTIWFIPNADSGASPTLAVDGLTARAINFSTGVSIQTGALKSGTPYAVVYIHASTEFILLGAVAVDAAAIALTGLNINGGTAETSPDTADLAPIFDASASGNRKMTLGNLLKVITTLTAETSPATDDELALYDTSAGTADKITLASLLKVINALTEDASPDGAADFLVTYDASASAAKKVLPSSLSATQPQQETGTATTSFVTPGRQHFHQSALKGWGIANAAGSAAASNNLTSVTDGGNGTITWTWAADFSSASYSAVPGYVSNTNNLTNRINAIAAGSTIIVAADGGGTATDPTSFTIMVAGTLA